MNPTMPGTPGFCINLDIDRHPREQIEELGAYAPPVIGDGFGRQYTMNSGIKPLDVQMKLCGPAITVVSSPGR